MTEKNGRKIYRMGIVNLTDDSFFAGSRCLGPDGLPDLEILRGLVGRHICRNVGAPGGDASNGPGATGVPADIIDLGACSTRPGSTPVSADEEWRRLEPALSLVRDEFPGVEISIDTFRPEVVSRAYEVNGPFIVNDVSGGSGKMLKLVGELGLRYIAMHNIGPASAVSDYGGDIVRSVHRFFEEFAIRADKAGVRDWILDPGFGFGKSVEQNWTLLDGLGALADFGRPVLVGVSRKRMLYEPLGLTPDAPDLIPITESAHERALKSLSCAPSLPVIFRVHP